MLRIVVILLIVLSTILSYGNAFLNNSVCNDIEKLCKGNLLLKIKTSPKTYPPEDFRNKWLYKMISKELDKKFMSEKQQMDIRLYNRLLKNLLYRIDVYYIDAINLGEQDTIRYLNLINDYIELEYLYMISNTVKIYGFEKWADIFSPSVELLDSIKIEEIHTHEDITIARFGAPEKFNHFFFRYIGKDEKIYYAKPVITKDDESTYVSFTFEHTNLKPLQEDEYEYLEGEFRFLDEVGEYKIIPQSIRLFN